MNDSQLIRPMKPEDLVQVVAIDRNSFNMPWPMSAYRYELKNPSSLLWVSEMYLPDQTPLVAGLIVLWLIIDEAHIASLAVHPDFRGLGVAHRLLSTALIEAIQRGLQTATLEVREQNRRAQLLYERFGFKIVGQRARYYRDNNEDALIMTVSGMDKNYLHWLENEDWETLGVHYGQLHSEFKEVH